MVSRDYFRTRAWARQIFQLGTWAGVLWWSYYDPRWASLGVWKPGVLTVEDVVPLRLDHSAFLEAANTILRRIIDHSPRSRKR